LHPHSYGVLCFNAGRKAELLERLTSAADESASADEEEKEKEGGAQLSAGDSDMPGVAEQTPSPPKIVHPADAEQLPGDEMVPVAEVACGEPPAGSGQLNAGETQPAGADGGGDGAPGRADVVTPPGQVFKSPVPGYDQKEWPEAESSRKAREEQKGEPPAPPAAAAPVVAAQVAMEIAEEAVAPGGQPPLVEDSVMRALEGFQGGGGADVDEPSTQQHLVVPAEADPGSPRAGGGPIGQSSQGPAAVEDGA
jgi:hypothetical protein